MILYFSGTGNSAYVAKELGKSLSENVLDLHPKIADADFSPLHSELPWVIVAPVYAWRIPRIVSDWLLRTELTGNRQVYFVVTCAEDAGNTERYAQKLCTEKHMEFMGCAAIIMPTNNIAMFQTPTQTEAKTIIAAAQPSVHVACEVIRTGKKMSPAVPPLTGQFKSRIVNPVFYALFVKTEKFFATEKCISCGKCVKICPLHDIQLIDGKPAWGKNCTHCMACINYCPTAAIEYGKQTKDRPRYHFVSE